MKKLSILLVVFWANLGLGQTDIVSTFTVIDYWTQELTPRSVSHKSLIPSGGELHGYQITPADLRLLNGAKQIVGLNPVTEPWLADWAKANQREADVLWLNPDPSQLHLHAWLNPDEARRMVTQLSHSLSKRLNIPSLESQVLLNKVLKDIDTTAITVKGLLSAVPESRRKIIIYHPNLESFAGYFGIQITATIVDSAVAESADPSVQRYSEILRSIKRENVRVIAYDEGQSSRIAEQLAKDGGLPPPISLSFEYLQPPGKEGDTWPSMMILNARKIAEALQK